MPNLALEVLTVDQVASALGCSPRTVEERARAGDLPGLKFGDGGWIFPLQALLQVLNKCATDQAEERKRPQTPAGVLVKAPKARASKIVRPELNGFSG